MNKLTPDERGRLVEAIHDSATVIHKGIRMNTRIREIIAQLGGIGYDEDGMELTPSLVGKNLENFAELIVHECLAFVEPSQYHKAYPDNMLGGVDGLELLYNRAERIREHFDV